MNAKWCGSHLSAGCHGGLRRSVWGLSSLSSLRGRRVLLYGKATLCVPLRSRCRTGRLGILLRGRRPGGRVTTGRSTFARYTHQIIVPLLCHSQAVVCIRHGLAMKLFLEGLLSVLLLFDSYLSRFEDLLGLLQFLQSRLLLGCQLSGPLPRQCPLIGFLLGSLHDGILIGLLLASLHLLGLLRVSLLLRLSCLLLLVRLLLLLLVRLLLLLLAVILLLLVRLHLLLIILLVRIGLSLLIRLLLLLLLLLLRGGLLISLLLLRCRLLLHTDSPLFAGSLGAGAVLPRCRCLLLLVLRRRCLALARVVVVGIVVHICLAGALLRLCGLTGARLCRIIACHRRGIAVRPCDGLITTLSLHGIQVVIPVRIIDRLIPVGILHQRGSPVSRIGVCAVLVLCRCHICHK